MLISNGSALTRKWGDSIKGAPRVTSTKKNAFKLIFRLPEEHWGEVSGFGHSEDHKDGYEVLWTPQGLIYGDYPGSKDAESGLRAPTPSKGTLRPFQWLRIG